MLDANIQNTAIKKIKARLEGNGFTFQGKGADLTGDLIKAIVEEITDMIKTSAQIIGVVNVNIPVTSQPGIPSLGTGETTALKIQ